MSVLFENEGRVSLAARAVRLQSKRNTVNLGPLATVAVEPDYAYSADTNCPSRKSIVTWSHDQQGCPARQVRRKVTVLV
jgi:hypothetical protein